MKKKLKKEDYISTIVGCFITFFIMTVIIRFLGKEYIVNNLESLLFAIGDAFFPAIIASIITLFSRSSIIGVGACSFVFIFGKFYLIFRDIYNMPHSTSNAYSMIVFISVTIFGVGICWAIKTVLTKINNSPRRKFKEEEIKNINEGINDLTNKNNTL